MLREIPARSFHLVKQAKMEYNGRMKMRVYALMRFDGR